MPRQLPPRAAEGVRAHLRDRFEESAERFGSPLVEDGRVLSSPPWARLIERIDEGEPVTVAAWNLGPFRPAGSSPSSRWTVAADESIVPAPPLS